MVEDRITDGRRIAELLAAEVEGREGGLAGLAVTDADPAAEPSPDGRRAYDVSRGGERVGRAFLQPDRVLLEVAVAPERALRVAAEAGLRARPKATDPPRTLVFVESGAEVKRATDVLAAVVGADNGD